ncbi:MULTISPECIES: TetR/AcrR family transcriptional regulator [Mycobacteriaceae]|uniref:TetR family transcriptional regulator n=1 Tax=Mycolicibacterium mucogenicum DSM 44124 TaxID=1226753 RepID=A0A8H2JI94_MYCMU|nr:MULTISPECIES: TetR/AcrR family transcriptional regulator [Mycobacteriaceae]QPG71534.1 TetR/AcrR family transcriptional regulator [Mycolicibacterium mucogenicum DSM 44124]
MTAGVEGQAKRRTQAERSAAMRTRLLDATVDCLVTYGYSGTTTQRVAEIAGVTRGAQVHHFRSKEDLVAAAIEHLAEQRVQAAIRDLGRVANSPDPVTMTLDYLWESHQGPIFVATLELWVAARTDRVLAEHIERVEPIVTGALISALAQLIPSRAAQKDLRDLAFTAMDALRGILLLAFVDRDTKKARKRWARVCEQLRGMFVEALAVQPGNAEITS